MYKEWILQRLFNYVVSLWTWTSKMWNCESVTTLRSWSFLICVWKSNRKRSFFEVCSVLGIALVGVSTQKVRIGLVLTWLSGCGHGLTHTISGTHLDIRISLISYMHRNLLFHGVTRLSLAEVLIQYLLRCQALLLNCYLILALKTEILDFLPLILSNFLIPTIAYGLQIIIVFFLDSQPVIGTHEDTCSFVVTYYGSPAYDVTIWTKYCCYTFINSKLLCNRLIRLFKSKSTLIRKCEIFLWIIIVMGWVCECVLVSILLMLKYTSLI